MSDQYSSFDIYKRDDPLVPPPYQPGAQAPGGGGIDWQDIARGGVIGGTERGLAGLAAIQGNAGDLIKYGLQGAGVPKKYLEPHPGIYSPFTSADVERAITPYTGKFPEPKTVPAQYMSSIAEAAPGLVVPGSAASRAFGTILPAVASETAGQITKGSAAEPYARAIAGVGTGLIAGRAVTPAPPATGARQAAVAAMDREGIPLWSNERTGSNFVRILEAGSRDLPLSSGAAQARDQAQSAALQRAIERHMFDRQAMEARGLPPEVTIPDPRAVATGRATLEDEYGRLSGANALRGTPQFGRELDTALANYQALSLPSQRPGGARDLAAIRRDIVDAVVAGGGQIPGETYQAIRSRMGTLAKQAERSDPHLAGALRDYRGALDRAMQAGLSPADAMAWRLNNQRWGNMKQLEAGLAGSSLEGMTPAKFAQAVRAGRGSMAARGGGDMDELARAASTVIRPFPSSGTSQREGVKNMWNIGTLAAGLGTGTAYGILPGVAAWAAPHAVSRFVVSDPGQRYLSNQVVPRTGRDLITQAVVQQAASQPSGIERNTAEQEAFRRNQEETRRKLGL